MHEKSIITISDIGMITPVGQNAEMTAASVRAGISSVQETEHFDIDGDPIKMALVPEEAFDVDLEYLSAVASLSAFQVRLLQLVCAAFPCPPNWALDGSVPVFIAGPEPLGSESPAINTLFLQVLSQLTKIQFDAKNSRCFNAGRAGGVYAVGAAKKYLEMNQDCYALVLGVDTFYDLDIAEHYLAEGRLLTLGSMRGFIPGEAAGFLGLCAATEMIPGAIILSEVGLSQEAGNILSDQPYRGDGLSSAFQSALVEARPNEIVEIFSSMNGEAYWAKELGVARTRSHQYFHENCFVHHPADCYGDIGAASSLVQAGLAYSNMSEKGGTLIYSSSDSAYRGAFYLRSNHGGGL